MKPREIYWGGRDPYSAIRFHVTKEDRYIVRGPDGVRRGAFNNRIDAARWARELTEKAKTRLQKEESVD